MTDAATPTPTPKPEGPKEGSSSWRRLLAAAETLPSARAKDGTCYLKLGAFWYPLFSAHVQGWLARRQIELGVMAGNAPERIAKILAAKLRDTKPQEFHLRVGHAQGMVALDLGREDGLLVTIDGTGWRLTTSSPVHFTRSAGMRALPTPVAVGRIEDLQRHVNVAAGDLPLVAGWLLAAFMPPASYPLLILNGEQGSAKSTTARILRSVVDPHETDLRPPFKSEDQLRAMLPQSLILAFDNLSGITPAQSDVLCRLCTGSVIGSRKLYTDGEEFTVKAQKPVLINGISDLVSRADLASRAIVLHLPRIAEGQRRTSEQVNRGFEADHPALLGILLDAVVVALRDKGNLGPMDLPRMADFILWCTAAEAAFGWQRGTTAAAFQQNQREAGRDILDNDPIAPEIISLVDQEGGFTGTQTDLHRKLDQRMGPCPLKMAALGKHLTRIFPILREAGLEASRKRVSGGIRLITITKR
jgi:putative DNA primase/helicase